MIDKPFTFGLLTSGGDAPGMNSCIRAVVRTATGNNAKVLGVIDGYEGLINGEFRQLGARDVGGILQRGGTILQTSRSPRFMEKKGQREAIRNLNEAGMDGLVVIGKRKVMLKKFMMIVVRDGHGVVVSVMKLPLRIGKLLEILNLNVQRGRRLATREVLNVMNGTMGIGMKEVMF